MSPSQPSGCSLCWDHHSTVLRIPRGGAEHQGPHHEAHGHGARPRGPPHRVEGLECPAVGLGAVPGRAGALLPPPGRAARGPLRCRSVGDAELGRALARTRVLRVHSVTTGASSEQGNTMSWGTLVTGAWMPGHPSTVASPSSAVPSLSGSHCPPQGSLSSLPSQRPH